MTSYQKLKKENAKLKKEIALLVFEPNSYEGITVKHGYILLRKAETAIMEGSQTTTAKFKGLITHISQS